MTVYVGQTDLQIDFTIEEGTPPAPVSLIGATVVVRALRPDGETVDEWPATVADADAGQVYWRPSSADDLGEPGAWRFWPHITFPDSRSVAGSPLTIRIRPEGE